MESARSTTRRETGAIAGQSMTAGVELSRQQAVFTDSFGPSGSLASMAGAAAAAQQHDLSSSISSRHRQQQQQPQQQQQHHSASSLQQRPPGVRRWAAAAVMTALLMLARAHAAAAASPGSISRILGTPAHWMQTRTYDAALDFSKADPHYATTGLPLHEVIGGRNVTLAYHTGFSYGNVALVRFGTRFAMIVRKSHWSAAARSQLPWYPSPKPGQDDRIRWWRNAVALCSVDSATLQPIRCQDYDPRTWEECWWGGGFEGQGVEDPRLFVWPGKGLYAMFGSKPWPRTPGGASFDELRCDGPLAFQQWLVLLEPFTAAPDPADPWMQGVVRLQYTADTNNTAADGLRREKNWVPFLYKGKLMFSQSLSPHKVVTCEPGGDCSTVFVTTSPAFRGVASSPRGNTQAVLVPAVLSGEPADFYLGICHIESQRSYTSYFYKMQARPPFKIYALSRPIPLVGGQNPWNKAWTNVSFPMSLDLLPEAHRVVIGYGSGDTEPRVMTLAWSSVRALFPVRLASQGRGASGGGQPAQALAVPARGYE